MQLTQTIFFIGAALTSISAAHPSHRHHHHVKRTPGAGGFYRAGRPGLDLDGNVKAASAPSSSSISSSSSSSISTSSTLSTPTIASTSTTITPSTTSTSSAAAASTSSSGTGQVKSFCPDGSKKDKRATIAQIMYTGNQGSCGWGSNMMEIDAGDIDRYDYTIVFRSPSEDMTCQCFNKMGPDGGLNGAFQNSAVKLSLPKGSVKAIAAEANTQAVCACGAGDSVPVCSSIGQWIGTWAEFDMGSDPNGGQSGADVSVLAAQDCPDGQSFPGMRIKANGEVCSWVTKDGAEEFQAYINGNHDADGVGCTGYTKNGLEVDLGTFET